MLVLMCKKGCKADDPPLEPFNTMHHCLFFYAKYQNIFKSKAQVKEIVVNSKDKNPQQVAYEIIDNPLLRDP